MNKSKLRELKPGREISTTVRILREPQHSSFKGKEIVKAESGDDRSIINPGALPVRCVIFPDPLSRITGVFADGTNTASLTVISYEVAETLIWEKRGDA